MISHHSLAGFDLLDLNGSIDGLECEKSGKQNLHDISHAVQPYEKGDHYKNYETAG